MKHGIATIGLLLSFFACGAQVRFVEGTTTDQLRQMAINEQKAVFIDLTAAWCGYCRLMEQEVFSTKEVGDFINQHFVAARYDVDKRIGRQLLNSYDGRGIPLYLIFDTEGNPLGRIEGACTARKLIADLQRILKSSAPKATEEP